MAMNEYQYLIYVLRFSEEKYHIGKIDGFERLLEYIKKQVVHPCGPEYKYIEIAETLFGDAYDVDKYVIIYMTKYGVDNVRGGSYNTKKLSMDQQLSIHRTICAATDTCTACGFYGHKIQDCKEDICYKCGRAGHLYNRCHAQEHSLGGDLNGCKRCGRSDHWAIRCNRSKDIFGRPLESNCLTM